MPEFIEIGGIVFLPHTWPLVFGLPAFLILAAIGGAIGGAIIDKSKDKYD
jgi:hypothetical protein